MGSIGSRWRFNAPGKYSYHCECPLGVRGIGDIYVVGPRPRMTPILTSPNNTLPVTYLLDAAASSVTDWKPWHITRYDFDLNQDEVFGSIAPDQSGGETSAPIGFDTPGEKVVAIRVTDNYDADNDKNNGNNPRQFSIPFNFQVPKQVTETVIKPIPDELQKPPDNSAFKRTYSTAKVKLTTRSKISLSALRKNGLSLKVSGLTVGDAVSATVTKGRLVKGKKSRKVGARTARATRTSVTLRIRLSKKATSILRAKPKAKIIRIGVLVEGATDGFSKTYAKNVRIG
jgi:hypothetical protein